MSEVNYKGVVTASALWVRSLPSTATGKKLDLLYNGETINAYELEGDWVKHDRGGWSCLKEDSGFQLIKITDFGESKSETKTQDIPPETKKEEEKKTDYSGYKRESFDNNENYSSASSFIKNARGIHGMPYQYMPSVDPRPKGSIFGRKFADKIVTKMPLLLITPGKPKFMKGFSDDEKSDILKFAAGEQKGVLDELLGREGTFYSFEFNYKAYYDYVNPMCQMLARLVGVQNERIDGKLLSEYDWADYTNSAFTSFVSSKESIAFYIDSETQISESFSNGTGESMLANKTNSMSDLGREMQFLLGGTSGVEFEKLKSENYDATLKEFEQFSNKWLKFAPQNLISNLGKGFLTVATGGKMVFPEIWNDSSFSKQYDVQIKLRTPDADVFSWYMNIAVPLLHLIALVAPQQMGPNAYSSPFLVRAFYKGFFNCNMGIITGMNITKGDKSKWTLNGLPTEVDVSLSIKDLYHLLSITRQKDIKNLMNNTALMDYLANMAGININKPDILRSVDLYKSQITNKIWTDITFDGFLGVEQSLSNLVKGFFRK